PSVAAGSPARAANHDRRASAGVEAPEPQPEASSPLGGSGVHRSSAFELSGDAQRAAPRLLFFQMPPDELNPRVTARKLPPRIARNRLEQAARDVTDRASLQQPIAAHLAARRIALDALATAHQ